MASSLDRHTDYGSNSLDEGSIDADPLAQFRLWLDDAEAAEIFEPNAMVVSTVDGHGHPASRTVLLKGLDATGFEFVTNYESAKGRALLANPAVSLLFPWYSLTRQVIVSGTAVPTEPAVSDAYFAGRPHDSKLASIASDQSQPVTSRAVLDERMSKLLDRFPPGSTVPRPDKWGGFRVTPQRIEFWQGRSARFHDRLVFAREGDGWSLTRLQP